MCSETAAAAGGAALLERAVSYTLGAIHLVTVDALAWATPCRAWDLRALLDHLDDSLVTLIGAVSVASPVRAELAHPRDGDPRVTVREHACELIGAPSAAAWWA